MVKLLLGVSLKKERERKEKELHTFLSTLPSFQAKYRNIQIIGFKSEYMIYFLAQKLIFNVGGKAVM